MRKFITRCIYFLLPLLILAYPLDCLMSWFLRQSKDYPGEFEVWNDIYNSNAACDIAVYGSSRAWVHIDPIILKDSLGLEVYNFGIDGHNFWLQYFRHREFLKHNKKPRYVLLAVDIFSLQKRTDLYELEQFLPYMLWNSDIQKYTSSYIGYNTYDYYIPMLRYAGKASAVKQIFQSMCTAEPIANFRYKGFAAMDREWGSDLEQAQAERKAYQIHIDTGSLYLFENFIQECKQKGIELLMVYTPEHIDGQRFVANRQELIELYKSMAHNYAIAFYDYSEHSICQDTKYFYNASHLNKKGANIFSKTLASDVKKQIQQQH